MKISEQELSYDIEYSYGRKYDCYRKGCDDICRCSEIIDFEITGIGPLTRRIYNLYYDGSKSSNRNISIGTILSNINEEINIYTIDRIIRHYKLWETEKWNIKIENSYYGEEIESIYLENYISDTVQNKIEEALDIDDLNERIRFLLNLEYGYIMNKLINCNFTIDTIDKKDILIGNETHLSNIKKLDLNHYNDNNFNYIRCIVRENTVNGKLKYQLIDGYHRLESTKSTKIKVIKAY